MPKGLAATLFVRSFLGPLVFVLTAGPTSASSLAFADDTCTASCLNCPCSSSSLGAPAVRFSTACKGSAAIVAAAPAGR